MTINHRLVLHARPSRAASADNFRMETAEIAALAPGQVLVRHHYLSLDPYMRGRMNDARSYAPPQPLGKVMVGATAGEVVESRSEQFVPGEMVVGRGGWQEYSVVEGPDLAALRKVDTSQIPLSQHLGALGAPGVTAWFGLTVICQPKVGETMLVSAATGAVGSAVGALAKARGCHTVGIAVCGMIAGYEGAAIPLAAPQLILTSRLTLQGFSIGEHADVWPRALAELGMLFINGKLRPRETIAQGLAQAPQAMLGLLRGRNMGKQLVKLV